MIEEGEFIDGELNGQGKQLLPNEVVIEGEFKRWRIKWLGKDN